MENINQNVVEVAGKLVALKKVWSSDNHVVYEGLLQVLRTSGYIDYLQILFNNIEPKLDSFIVIQGQFRSRDLDNNGKLKVDLYVYATKVTELENLTNSNDIEMTGYVCKKPTLRTTPSGKQIADLLVACNYSKDKTAYIPVIVWGKCARKSGKYDVGTLIKINGRVQSRKYTKFIDNEIKEFTAYELSANSVDEII